MAALKRYRAKRDFSSTPEPVGGGPSKGPLPIFVVQEHDATAHHFDFRLEVDGVLKSWAVPKGPSLDPAVKRLAIETEDHPMDYARFEGVIPKGEYGGGPVIVWDTGQYTNLSHDGRSLITMEKAYEKGHLAFWLHGSKLVGSFDLIQIRREEAKPPWLLSKRADAAADPKRDPVATQPRSVLSGQRLADVQNAEAKVRSGRATPKKKRVAQ